MPGEFRSPASHAIEDQSLRIRCPRVRAGERRPSIPGCRGHTAFGGQDDAPRLSDGLVLLPTHVVKQQALLDEGRFAASVVCRRCSVALLMALLLTPASRTHPGSAASAPAPPTPPPRHASTPAGLILPTSFAASSGFARHAPAVHRTASPAAPAPPPSARGPRTGGSAWRMRSFASPAFSVDDALAQGLGALDEHRVVEQRQRLQRRVRALAADAADVRVRRVEGHQHRIGAGALEPGVQAAAIAVGPGALDPAGAAGVGQLGDAGRLRRPDARAADGARQQAADRQGVVAQRSRPPGACRVCRASSTFSGSRLRQLRPGLRRLPIGRRGDDQPVQRLQAPLLLRRTPSPASRAVRDATASRPGCRSPPAWRRGRGRNTCARPS